MFNIKLVTLLSGIATLSSAQNLFFDITNLTSAAIKQNPPYRYHVEFTISNPNAVPQQGGSDPERCELIWSNNDSSMGPRTCFTNCDNGSKYYARITPGTYKSAGDLSVDLLEWYSYKNSALNNATLSLQANEGGFSCSPGRTTVCRFWDVEGYDVPFDVDFDTVYGVEQPSPVC